MARAVEVLADDLSESPKPAPIERQRLVLADIVAAGGQVTTDEWKEIAAQHGYHGRGRAGFFRKSEKGLLSMTDGIVRITQRGVARLESAIRV